jgi:hypothetical protein
MLTGAVRSQVGKNDRPLETDGKPFIREVLEPEGFGWFNYYSSIDRHA